MNNKRIAGDTVVRTNEKTNQRYWPPMFRGSYAVLKSGRIYDALPTGWIRRRDLEEKHERAVV